MARMIPALLDPETKSRGEREVFVRLRDDPLTEDWIVLHSQWIAHHERAVEGEADFVVIIPGKGVLGLEVKAASRIERRDDGLWRYGESRELDRRGPFRQAAEAAHSIREYVSQQMPALRGIVFWSAVLFPYVNFAVKSDEWHPWQALDAQDFRSGSLASSILTVLDKARHHLEGKVGHWFDPDTFRPTSGEAAALASLLRPRFEFFESSQSRRERRDLDLKRYTEEQFEALDTLELNPRVVFEGPAGTGKTMLAIETARRAAAQGHRTLLLCFNSLLAKWLDEETEDLRAHVTCRTIHRYMLDLAKLRAPEDAQPAFWAEILPEAATEELLAQGEPDALFDELIVDEAQDILRDSFLDVLDLSLRGGLSAGCWRLFGDFEKQTLYEADLVLHSFREQRGSGAALGTLRVNCRNTPRIASLTSLLGGLKPGYSRVRRPDDGVEADLRFYESTTEQANQLEETLEKLYAEGFSGDEIVILSPRADQACATTISKQPWTDRLSPLRTRKKGRVGFGTIHAFKGLEAPVIIVTDVEHVAGERAQALFYIAVTRTVERLILLVHEKGRAEILQALTGPSGRVDD